jgi:hypothetical protein
MGKTRLSKSRVRLVRYVQPLLGNGGEKRSFKMVETKTNNTRLDLIEAANLELLFPTFPLFSTSRSRVNEIV